VVVLTGRRPGSPGSWPEVRWREAAREGEELHGRLLARALHLVTWRPTIHPIRIRRPWFV
jgi:hypothetical protein